MEDLYFRLGIVIYCPGFIIAIAINKQITLLEIGIGAAVWFLWFAGVLIINKVKYRKWWF